MPIKDFTNRSQCTEAICYDNDYPCHMNIFPNSCENPIDRFINILIYGDTRVNKWGSHEDP